MVFPYRSCKGLSVSKAEAGFGEPVAAGAVLQSAVAFGLGYEGAHHGGPLERTGEEFEFDVA
jgi:hypothetical protein